MYYIGGVAEPYRLMGRQENTYVVCIEQGAVAPRGTSRAGLEGEHLETARRFFGLLAPGTPSSSTSGARYARLKQLKLPIPTPRRRAPIADETSRDGILVSLCVNWCNYKRWSYFRVSTI